MSIMRYFYLPESPCSVVANAIGYVEVDLFLFLPKDRTRQATVLLNERTLRRTIGFSALRRLRLVSMAMAWHEYDGRAGELVCARVSNNGRFSPQGRTNAGGKIIIHNPCLWVGLASMFKHMHVM